MIIFGGDISMNGSGLVKYKLDENLNVIEKDYLTFTSVIYKSERSNGKILLWDPEMFPNYIEKNRWFHNHIINFVNGSEYCALENYSFASKGLTFNIAEFTGLLKYLLYEKEMKIRLYAPTVVKKFATSYGAKGKNLVVDAYDQIELSNKFNLDYLLEDKSGVISKRKNDPRYESPRADIIDAYFLVETLLMELKLRRKILSVDGLDKKKKEIFFSKSKKTDLSVMETKFLQKG